jgi:hypothetical protein
VLAEEIVDIRSLLNGPPRGVGKAHYQSHPSHRVLRDYIQGTLEDGWRFADKQVMKDFGSGELGDWNLSEVSLHVITCPRCQAKVAQMRAEELAKAHRGSIGDRLQRSRERMVSWDMSKGMAYYLPLAGMTAALLTFLINVFWGSGPPLDWHGGGGGDVFLTMP